MESILDTGLDWPARIDLHTVMRRAAPTKLDLGEWAVASPPPDSADFAPRESGALASVFGGRGRYERELALAQEDFEQAERVHAQKEAARRERVRDQRARHQVKVRAHHEEIARHNREVPPLARRPTIMADRS